MYNLHWRFTMSYMCWLVALGNPNFMDSMDFLHLKTMSADFILFIKYEELHYFVGHHYYRDANLIQLFIWQFGVKS